MARKPSYELAVSPPPAMGWEEYRSIILIQWHQLLATKACETAVQAFLEHHPCLVPMHIDPIVSGYTSFPSAIISQPILPGFTGKVPDFMWISGNSFCLHPTHIEIEAPSKQRFADDGRPASDLTEALDAFAQWKVWFRRPLNDVRFREYYRIPHGFGELKPIYILIYGRQSKANGIDELHNKSMHLGREDEFTMTYDQLTPQYHARKFFCA